MKDKIKKNKPSVAFSNQASAEKNIVQKIAILEALLAEAKLVDAINIPNGRVNRSDGSYCDFPRTVRQFNLWDSDKGPNFEGLNELRVFRNSNQTLRKYFIHHQRLIDVIKQLSVLSLKGAERTAGSPVRKLKKQLQDSELRRKILETALLDYRHTNEELASENQSLRDQCYSLQKLLNKRKTQ